MSERIVILGAAESGVGAALLAKAKGFDVFVSDRGAIHPANKELLNEHQIPFEENQHTESLILNAKEVIKSPGIPDRIPLIQKLHETGVPVIAELEFAARYTDARFIAITGTNGKTTTTLLTYHLLRAAGYNVALAGNIGISLARQLVEGDYDWIVLEVSSFQLDGMFDFKADIGVLLNITIDHLDRYNDDLQLYVNSKFRLLQNMTEKDRFVYFTDDQNIRSEVEKRQVASEQYRVSLNPHAHKGARLVGDEILFSLTEAGKTDFSFSTTELPLRGKHNLVNMMSAITAAELAGVTKEQILEGLKSFRNAPHRLEPVAVIDGVQYINDSKATNVDAAWYGLESFQKNVIWIAGGTDKGNDYSMLDELIHGRVKALVCMGKDNSKLLKHFEGKIPQIFDTDSLEGAIGKATELAEEGDVVLLSPACASFDLFKNYEDRGEQFRQAVLGLNSKQENGKVE